MERILSNLVSNWASFKSPSYRLTLRARERAGILGSPSWFARWCRHQQVEISLSPSLNFGVPHRILINSCLLKPFSQNVASRVVVTIQYRTAAANIGSGWQRFLNKITTIWTVLGSILRHTSNHCFTVYLNKVLQALSKLWPRCITNRFSKLVVLNHILHLKLDLGYKIARFHRSQRRLDGKVFTLPADLQVLSS